MDKNSMLQKMRIEILKNSQDTSNDDLFSQLLDDAEAIALNLIYPFNNTQIALDNSFRLKSWQVRCAIELYWKIGKTGIQSYSENGLSVTFLGQLISIDLKNELLPKAGAIK